MSNHKNDISQIRKYLTGELDAPAMHQLERRALDDPFLADALEGYGNAAGTQKVNLAELSERLQSRVDKKVRRMIPWAPISVAASVLVIIGVGAWLLTGDREPEKQNRVAADVKLRKQEQVPAISAPSSFAQQKSTDTLRYAANQATRRSTDAQSLSAPQIAEADIIKPQEGYGFNKSDSINAALASTAAASPVMAKEKPMSADVAKVLAKQKDSLALNEVVMQRTADKNTDARKKITANQDTKLQGYVEGLDVKPAHKTVSGYVTGTDGGQPLIGAVVKLAGANFGVLTDANGKFVMHDVPDKKNIVVNYIGYKSKQVKLNGDSVSVALTPAGSALSEVATTATPKSKSNAGVITEAHPSLGWKALTEYLDKNAVSPDGKTGKVKLTFKVDGQGNLTDFKVVKSLSPAADQKAIDIVSKGPGWAGNIDGQPHEVKLDVVFR